MREIDVRKVLCLVVIMLCLLPMSAMATVSCDTPAAYYNALDTALRGSTGGTCSLTGAVNSTLTEGNLTYFDKTITINFAGGSYINLNNTIQFNGTSKTTTFSGVPNFTYNATSFTTGSGWNSSLINIIGYGQTLNSAKNITLNAGGYTGTGINISAGATSNNLAQFWLIGGDTTDLAGYAINLSGTNNRVTMSSLNITTSANQGKLFLTPTATGNTITDIDFASHAPSVYIYNGTALNPANTNATRSAWYFYNSSWSTSGSNMNITINVSPLIPITGNVAIKANLTNVSFNDIGGAIFTNSTLNVANGYSGGFIFNKTEKTIFRTFPAMVPVNITFGNNYFGGSYQELNIGTVYVLNFNPVNSTTPGTGKFNVTGTTNWSTIPDFSNAQNVTFVVDSGASPYTLYGNLSFLDPLDLTNPSTGTGLANLGTNLVMSANGNSIELKGSATGMSALNKAAMLTVYPTFTFTEGSTNIQVTADGNQIYNKGTYSRGSYLSNSATITVGRGNITLPVLHFTSYDFGSGTSPTSSSVDNGGGAAPGSVAQQNVVQQQVVAETKTVSVNTGGNSAITMVAVTGTGINDVIVTAVPQSELPASITAPATTVYQYVAVTPARYTTISSATFNFKVPASWLADKGFSNKDIALTLWDPDAKTWTSLQTSIVSSNQYETTYQVIVPHMSEFAIVYQKGAAAQAQANVTAIQTTVPVKTATTYMATTTPSIRPTTPTQTQTVAPAANTPPIGGTPLNTMVIAVVGIIVIVVGAFLVHRWWIRKQNPELFKDLK